jgi:hypothetical protein
MCALASSPAEARRNRATSLARIADQADILASVVMGVMLEAQHVRARPTKAFFVHTITRDIELEDCILDLIDNAMDGARRLLGNPVPKLLVKSDFSKFLVDLKFNESEFLIQDNCGGISLNDAINYAFSFGRRQSDEPEDYSIGVYGIGMKRAVFKLGKDIVIRSTGTASAEDDRDEPYRVIIDVAKWVASDDDSWDFDLESDDALPHPGVQIVVRDLHETIAAELSSRVFETQLRRTLARDYARFISQGLTIRVNGRNVGLYEFGVLEGDGIRPAHVEHVLRDVTVEIIAGMGARPSDTGDPDEEGDKEDLSGWYLLCNDRVVVAADKSDLTGWGYDAKNRWHPQYRGFIGIVLFSAKAAEELPLTTTKRSINRDNFVYRQALARMIELTSEWIAYTNRRKAALVEAKAFEKAAVSVSAFETQHRREAVYPTFAAAPRVRAITIQYPKPQRAIRELAVSLGDPGMSSREVGSRSFDYAHRELVGGGE